ncbi:MAG: serine/threonine-protein kinase [Planctomycetota bacterium]
MAQPETIDERSGADGWDRLKDVVADALERPATERLRLLEDAIGDDPDLFAQAVDLIDAVGEDASMLNAQTDAFIGLSGPDTAALDGRRIGQFQLQRLLGEGAMASVYLAKQDDVGRPVALKVFRPHALGHDALLRFRREVDALGRIEHPFVARIFEANIHYDIDLPGKRGLPYIAMEYVDGLPVTHFARERKLDTEQRIRLIADIADAVHAAHQKAIVHRDLKPGNVLVADDRNYGTPKVLDFGIARVLEEVDATAAKKDRVQTLHTTTGVLLGTLGYMAPEQARGQADKIDTRADVFAIGVMLHELLTGKRPVDTDGLPLTEVLRRLSDPSIPSPDGVDGDLRTILQTALDPEPARRYPSAEALADDLRRTLRHEPITARPPTRMYLTRKFVRRNWIPVTAGAAVAVALLAGTVVSTVAFLREANARAQVEVAAQQSIQTSEFLRSMLVAADPGEMGRDVTVQEMIRAAEPRIAVEFANNPPAEATLRLALAQTYSALGYINDADAQYVRHTELLLDAYGPEDETVIAVVSEHAGMLINAGEVEKGGALLDAHADAVERLDPMSKGAIMFDESRANLLVTIGNYDDGLILYADMFERARQSDDPENFDTMANNYAIALSYAGEIEKSIEINRISVEHRRNRLGPNHPETLMAEVNYAQSIQPTDPIAASKLLSEVVPALSEQLGPLHPTSIAARRGLGELLVEAGDVPGGVAVLEELLADMINGGLSDLQMVRNSLGTALSKLERHDEALEQYRLALDAIAEELGPEHPNTLIARANYATGLGNAGQNEAAREQLKAILDIQRRTVGPDNINTLITMNNLAMIDLELGRLAEAEALLRPFIDGLVLVGAEANIPLARRNLGRVLTAAEKFADAEAELRLAFEGCQQLLGVDQQIKTAGYLVELYEKWGKPDEANMWREVQRDLG